MSGPLLTWLEAHKHHTGHECLIWPFKSKDPKGYGKVRFGGRETGAHRAMLELTAGPLPAGKVCAHSCGNGRLGCVNPQHLRAATTAENAADKVKHGTMQRGSKHYRAILNEAQVMEIFAATEASNGDLSRKYGVSKMAIIDIKKKRSWGWLTSGPPIMEPLPIREGGKWDGRKS